VFKSHTLEYQSWRGLIHRCTQDSNIGYKNYKGRGIKVCDRWLAFENFLEDMGEKPTPKHSIDRINNDGDYEPSNCRWVTQATQVQNSRRIRSTNTSGYRGVHYNNKAKNWRAVICVNYKLIHLGGHATAKEAAMTRDRYIMKNNLSHTRNFEVEHGL